MTVQEFSYYTDRNGNRIYAPYLNDGDIARQGVQWLHQNGAGEAAPWCLTVSFVNPHDKEFFWAGTEFQTYNQCAAQKFGRLDILINNAGIRKYEKVDEASGELDRDSQRQPEWHPRERSRPWPIFTLFHQRSIARAGETVDQVGDEPWDRIARFSSGWT